MSRAMKKFVLVLIASALLGLACGAILFLSKAAHLPKPAASPAPAASPSFAASPKAPAAPSAASAPPAVSPQNAEIPAMPNRLTDDLVATLRGMFTHMVSKKLAAGEDSLLHGFEKQRTEVDVYLLTDGYMLRWQLDGIGFESKMYYGDPTLIPYISIEREDSENKETISPGALLGSFDIIYDPEYVYKGDVYTYMWKTVRPEAIAYVEERMIFKERVAQLPGEYTIIFCGYTESGSSPEEAVFWIVARLPSGEERLGYASIQQGHLSYGSQFEFGPEERIPEMLAREFDRAVITIPEEEIFTEGPAN